MASHFKLIAFGLLLFLTACSEHIFEDDISKADIQISAGTAISNSKVNSLYSEFLNWDSLDFEFAYKEPNTEYSKGPYVFICKQNTPNDTIKIGINPVNYNVKDGYYLLASVSGSANRYNGSNLSFDAQNTNKMFYRQLNSKEGELYVDCYVFSQIRTPNPNQFRRWIRGRFVIPR